MTIITHKGHSRTGPLFSKFTSTWDTTKAGSDNDTVVLPLVADGNYNFYIDWGDGKRDTITGYNQSEVTHEYSNTGVYTIQVVGESIVGWQFNNSGDDDKITNISDWGSLDFVSDDTNLFKGCSNLTLSTTTDPPFNADAAGMFQDCTSLSGTGGNILNWDLSSVTGMNFMLAGCSTLDVDLSNWSVASIESATGFMSGTALSTTNYDRILSGWSSQGVQSGVTISFGSTKFSQATGQVYRNALVASGWTVLDGGAILTSIPRFIGTWDTRNVYYGSTANNKIILPLWSDGSYDFYVDWGDGTAEQNITSYNSSDGAHTYSTPGIYTISITGTLRGWAYHIGAGGATLRSDLPDWNTVQDMAQRLTCVHDWSALQFNPEGYAQFYTHTKLTGVPEDMFNVPASGSIQSAFQSCNLLNDSNMTGWDMSAVTKMQGSFSYMGNFNQNIGAWDVSNVITFNDCFNGCTSFNNGGSSDINNWNPSSATNFDSMFYGNTSFNQPVGGWDTSSATTMNNTFRSCSAFNNGGSSNISGWDTSNVTTMIRTFMGATSFDQDIGPWDVSSVTNGTAFMNGITLSTSNYNSLLQGWAPQSVQNGVTFDFGSSQYSAGAAATARATLVSKGWTITDGGQA